MDEIIKSAIAVLAFIVGISWIFTKTLEKYGIGKAFIVSMLFTDIFLVVFLVLGVDRPLFTVYTRIGSTTFTAVEVLLFVKLPITAYLIAKSNKVVEVLG